MSVPELMFGLVALGSVPMVRASRGMIMIGGY